MEWFVVVCSFLTIVTATPFHHFQNSSIIYKQHLLPENVNNTILSYINRQHPHVDLDVIEIIRYYEYRAETYTVETKDGYRLQVHRIPGTKKNPKPSGKPVVFLQHGLLCSSMDWIVAGPEKGLAFILADAGYDVWIGNVRGNVHSRRHKRLTVDDPEYWNFSWHEIGAFDLPAMIDFALRRTGREKLFYIGHSQGTTSFYVMTSELPEYNNKIHAMFSLAPIAFSSQMYSPIFQTLSKFLKPIDLLSSLIGVNEFKPTSKFFSKFKSTICKEEAALQPVCRNSLFMITGFNKDQMDMELLPAILAHLPAGASVNQFVHYGQLIKSGHFRQMDLGLIGNLAKYKSIVPPAYNLKNIKAPVALFYSVNDWLSNPKDVEVLYSKLSNPIGKFRVNDSKFNHLDYLWARDIKTLVYSKVINLMSRYKD